MTATLTVRPTITRWDRRRDKYGRTTHVAITAEGGEYGDLSLVGAVVTMPKLVRQAKPEQAYLVNCWGKGETPQRGEVTYHRTLAAAKGYFAANALTRAEFAAAVAR
jgi:hypothetical protein